MGFPVDSAGKEPTCQSRRHNRREFNPWVRKISWRRKWQPTPVFLLGNFRGQGSLAGSSPWDCKELDTTEHPCTHTHNQRQNQNAFYHKTHKYISNKYTIPYMHNTKSQPWKLLLWKNKPKSIISSLKFFFSNNACYLYIYFVKQKISHWYQSFK